MARPLGILCERGAGRFEFAALFRTDALSASSSRVTEARVARRAHRARAISSGRSPSSSFLTMVQLAIVAKVFDGGSWSSRSQFSVFSVSLSFQSRCTELPYGESRMHVPGLGAADDVRSCIPQTVAGDPARPAGSGCRGARRNSAATCGPVASLSDRGQRAVHADQAGAHGAQPPPQVNCSGQAERLWRRNLRLRLARRSDARRGWCQRNAGRASQPRPVAGRSATAFSWCRRDSSRARATRARTRANARPAVRYERRNPPCVPPRSRRRPMASGRVTRNPRSSRPLHGRRRNVTAPAMPRWRAPPLPR